MILPDVNILLYAYDREALNHKQARRWWEETVNGSEEIGFAWVVVLGFLRIATHRKAFQNPLPVAEAIQDVRSWLNQPVALLLTPGESHAGALFGLIESMGTAGDLVTDAHLAALAIEYGARIATTDRDFARFRGVKWFNPLAK